MKTAYLSFKKLKKSEAFNAMLTSRLYFVVYSQRNVMCSYFYCNAMFIPTCNAMESLYSMGNFKSKTPFKNTMINCNSYKKGKGRANKKPTTVGSNIFFYACLDSPNCFLVAIINA